MVKLNIKRGLLCFGKLAIMIVMINMIIVIKW